MGPGKVSERIRLASELLDPTVISRLGNLEIIAKLVVEGFVSGLHRSPFHGFSVEFSDHRPYFPGDEIRYVDWKVFGKTDRYYVKRFEEETNLKAYLLLDASNSMSFTSGNLTKLRYATLLAASLSYLMLKQQDSVGLVVFDRGIREFLSPASARTQLNALLKNLSAVTPGGETRTRETFQQLAGKIKRRGLILVLSDLLTDPMDVVRGLRYFRHQKHEVIVFHILDPGEIELRGGAEVIFRDLESGEEIQAPPREIRDGYRTRMTELIDFYKTELRDSMVDYHQITTDVPFYRALLDYLRKRSRLG
jgi:uncharacterized protein (DUF58 family)